MSERTDAEFEHMIHDPIPVRVPTAESDSAKQFRAGLEPTQAVEDETSGELPAQSVG